jgi:transposase
MSTVKTLSIQEIAEMIDVPAKTIRRVLRANVDATPGRGGRWAINANDVEKLKALIAKNSSKSATVATLPDVE